MSVTTTAAVKRAESCVTFHIKKTERRRYFLLGDLVENT